MKSRALRSGIILDPLEWPQWNPKVHEGFMSLRRASSGCVDGGEARMEMTSPKGPEDRRGRGRLSLGTLSRRGMALLQAGVHLTVQTSALWKGDRTSPPSCLRIWGSWGYKWHFPH